MIRSRCIVRDRLRGAVLEHEAVEVSELGIPHGGVHAHAGGRTDDDERRDTAFSQDGLQFGPVEAGVAVLVEHPVSWSGPELVDDVDVPGAPVLMIGLLVVLWQFGGR